MPRRKSATALFLFPSSVFLLLFLSLSFTFCLILSPSVAFFLLLSLCLSLSLATKRQTTVGQKNLTTQSHRSAHDETFKPARTTGSRQLVCWLNPGSAGNIRNGDQKKRSWAYVFAESRPCLLCLAEKQRVQLFFRTQGGKTTDGTLPWGARCKAPFLGWSAAAAARSCLSVSPLRLCCICRNLQCQCNRHSALRNLPWCVQQQAPKSPRHMKQLFATLCGRVPVRSVTQTVHSIRMSAFPKEEQRSSS